MEIKRRLTKLGKQLSPQIEVMNVSLEMNRLLDRFEELVRYAQEKIDRSAERKGISIGQAAKNRIDADRKIIEDHQQAEAAENLKDQEDAYAERNKLANKSKKPKAQDFHGELADGTVMANPDAVVPEGQVGVTDDELNKKAPVKKKQAKKKAKPVNKVDK